MALTSETRIVGGSPRAKKSPGRDKSPLRVGPTNFEYPLPGLGDPGNRMVRFFFPETVWLVERSFRGPVDAHQQVFLSLFGQKMQNSAPAAWSEKWDQSPVRPPGQYPVEAGLAGQPGRFFKRVRESRQYALEGRPRSSARFQSFYVVAAGPRRAWRGGKVFLKVFLWDKPFCPWTQHNASWPTLNWPASSLTITVSASRPNAP